MITGFWNLKARCFPKKIIEEVKSVRSQLESVRKEITMLKDFSDGNQDDLIALRSETSRRSLEYEGQILKLKESEKNGD